MLREVEIKENPLPTPRSKPWSMHLEKDGKTCRILVTGFSGSKKAGFKVQFADLAAGVKELEGGEA
jgi:phage regulator Rha-like protein